MSTALAIRPDQNGFDDQQLAALRALGVSNAPAGDIALLFHQAARTGLDPFARQIYLIGRGGKFSIMTGIDGFRVIRDRKGTYRGHTEEWCGPDGAWRDVWLESKPPAAARVSVYVDGFHVPVVGVARWTEYAQETSPTWKKMPALMLAKCAEALALRKAYPQDLSGLYTDDEIPAADVGTDGVQSVTHVQPATRAAQGKRDTHTKPPFDPAPYEDQIAIAETIQQLGKVRAEAVRLGHLQERMSNGQTLDQELWRAKARLEQDAHTEPAGEEPEADIKPEDAYEYASDALPF